MLEQVSVQTGLDTQSRVINNGTQSKETQGAGRLSINILTLIEKYQILCRNRNSQHFLSNSLLNQDIWHTVEDLSLKVNEHSRDLTLNFSEFSQDWLELLVKLYVLMRATPGTSANTISISLVYLRRFSKFLHEQSVYSPSQINNHVFEAFDYYLHSSGKKQNSIAGYYRVLSNFFNICRIEGWLDVETYWFKGRCKPYRPKNDEIAYLPEEVWNQLDQNLHHLPEPLQRMVLLIRTTGARIGEICNMPFDCLRKRGSQWRIRFTTEKYDTEDELPILVPELVAVIKEQQEYIRKHLSDEYDKLFCANGARRKNAIKNKSNKTLFEPIPKVMLSTSFNRWLNKLAVKCEIHSSDGKLWHFQSHQFRRSVATIMTNAGIRNLIIMKYLRHRSPEMLHHYTHLLKQVLGDEFEELMREKKYVDITGEVAVSYKPKNPLTEFLRQRMHQITTQYGECHRPQLKNPCSTINACLSCEHWRTTIDDLPYLKDDLQRIEAELEIAIQMGMVRQQWGLKGDCDNLLSHIRGLEAINE